MRQYLHVSCLSIQKTWTLQWPLLANTLCADVGGITAVRPPSRQFHPPIRRRQGELCLARELRSHSVPRPCFTVPSIQLLSVSQCICFRLRAFALFFPSCLFTYLIPFAFQHPGFSPRSVGFGARQYPVRFFAELIFTPSFFAFPLLLFVLPLLSYVIAS